MGEDFIGSEAPQLTVVLRRRRRRRIRRRRRRSSSSSSSSSRNRQRRQPMSKFHLQLLTFILEIREVKIKYSVLEIQIAEICETLQSTQIFLGRSDRSSSSASSSLLSFHCTQQSICLALPLNIRRYRLRFSATGYGCLVRFFVIFLQSLQEPAGNVTLEVATWRFSRNFYISYLTVMIHFDAV
jgi:hypothetical protein